MYLLGIYTLNVSSQFPSETENHIAVLTESGRDLRNKCYLSK